MDHPTKNRRYATKLYAIDISLAKISRRERDKGGERARRDGEDENFRRGRESFASKDQLFKNSSRLNFLS